MVEFMTQEDNTHFIWTFIDLPTANSGSDAEQFMLLGTPI